MSYTISYKGFTGDVKRRKAIQDSQNYLGEQKYSQIARSVACYVGADPSRKSIRQARNLVSLFCGIQGYPAIALIFDAIRNYKS